MSRFVDRSGQPGHVPNARERIAAEMHKMHRPTGNTPDPARQAERLREDARRAEYDAQQAAEWHAEQTAMAASPQPAMRPNRAQGASHSGAAIQPQPTAGTPAERIRAITRAKLDGALLPPHHQ